MQKRVSEETNSSCLDPYSTHPGSDEEPPWMRLSLDRGSKVKSAKTASETSKKI